ncbi:radical SAM/SPASM domain Clo7bot peptide maturase [Bacteroidia bacterium]|nr:radical SAM/SPASM domain Clo7bot peptide maturase [Bacteroidia bacterium]
MANHWSKYNFLIELDNCKFLLYNSYTNNLMEVDNDDYNRLLQIKTGDFTNIPDSFLQELNDNSILVENDDTIFQKIKLTRLNNRFRSDTLLLAITPTMACNFACPYCFEENAQKGYTMTEDTINDIITLVKLYKNLQSLNVVWYGGEPLLGFDKIIEITKKIQQLPIDNYGAFMITNGYLLDKNKISKLKELRISKIQITIDGLENTHNQRRPHKQKNDSFQKIISNLIELYKEYPEIITHIRVNLDKNNMDEFFELNDYLKSKIQNPLLILYPAYVTEYNNSCKSSFCLLNQTDQANFAIKNGDKYSFDKFYYPQTSVSECSARVMHNYVIGARGELYKCWCDVGNEDKIVGNIKDGITNTNLYTKYMCDADPLYDKNCVECSYFPICNGGCPFVRLKHEESMDVCTIQKNRLKDFLTLHYKKNENTES